MKVVVVGGGVAGPALGLALARAGIESVVLERRAEIDPEAGSYFTISPNGLDALDTIGALALAREVGFPSRTNRCTAPAADCSARSRSAGRWPTARWR